MRQQTERTHAQPDRSPYGAPISAQRAQGLLHKARTAAKYRRPTRVFEDAVQKSDSKYLLSLDDVIASRGGIPLSEGGRIIGAIGCSGGTGSQDEAVCTVAAELINKTR